MSTFPESGFVKKLGEFNLSQESIQTLSLWLIHYRKHFETIVKIWYQELIKAPIERKILFMYLANDVIQTSRKKGREYCNEFGSILPIAIHHMAGFQSLDAESRDILKRIIKIWGERGIYETGKIEQFKKALRFKKPVKNKRHSLKDGDKKKRGPRTPSGDPPEDDKIISILPVNDKRRSHEDVEKKMKKKRVDSPAECNKKTVKSEIKAQVEEKKDTRVKISRGHTSGEPPEDDEIICIFPVNPKRRSRKDGDRKKRRPRTPSGDPLKDDEIISILPANDKRRSRKDRDKKKRGPRIPSGGPPEDDEIICILPVNDKRRSRKDGDRKKRGPRTSSGDPLKDDEIISILPANDKRRSRKDGDKKKRGPRIPSGGPPEDDEIICILPVNDKRRSRKDGDRKKRGPRTSSGDPPEDDEIICILPVNDKRRSRKDGDKTKRGPRTLSSDPLKDDKIISKLPVNDKRRSRKDEEKTKRGPRTPSGDPPEDDKKRSHEDEDKTKTVGSPAECNKKTVKSEIKAHVEEKKDNQVKISRCHTSGEPPKDDKIISILPVNDEGLSHESEYQKNEKKQKGVDSPAECNEKTAKPEIKPQKDTQVKTSSFYTSVVPPEDNKIIRILPVNDNNGDTKKRGPRTPPGEPPEDDDIFSISPMPYSPEECNEKPEIEPHVQEKKDTPVKTSSFYTYGVPPDDDEIIRALLDLENSPSADAALREAIANMPPEITEDSFLKTITDKNQAKQHLQSVSAACRLLTNYNERLDKELEDRKEVMTMLRNFTIVQLSVLSEAKERLEQYQGILQSARSVRQEVQSHLDNLPDIKQDVLEPLPAVDVLFNIDI